jgi:hypothetical protein
MKNILITFHLLTLICINGFSQIDEIKKTNGENIICKVDSINPTHVFFHYPNETESKYISKISIDYVRYNSGRFYKIENKEKYPKIEKESFIEECYKSSIKNISDTIHPIKKLNYCLSSFKTIESKVSYKEMYKMNKLFLNDKNDPLLQDFLLDVYLVNYNEIFNSHSFVRYKSFINENSNITCDCITRNINNISDITTTSMDCIKNYGFKRMTTDRKYFTSVFYNIFKDTTSDFIGKIVGENLLKDIEKDLYDNCEVFLNEKIKERNKRLGKYKLYNKDSLRNELNNLVNNNKILNDEYYEKRGLLYFELGEYEKCLSDFNTSYNIKPRNSVLYFKYELYDLLNDYDNSIKYLKELRNKSKLKFDSNLLLLEKLKSMEMGKFSL